MSLEDLDEIYRLYDVPLEKRFAELRKQLSRSRTQKPQKDTKFDDGSLGLNSYNYAKIVNDHYNIKLHDLGTSEYFPATEPDYNTCKLILLTDHFGYKLFDDAQITSNATEKTAGKIGDGQEVYCFGEPKLEGGFDRGYGDNTNSKKRQALHFNRNNSPTQWQDYIRVVDSSAVNFNKTFRISDSNTLSWFIRVKFDGFENNGTVGSAPTLFAETDDSSNQMRMFVTSAGQIRWQYKKGGTEIANSANTLSVNTDYEIWFTYDHLATPKMHIIVNGTDQSLTTQTASAYGSGTNDDLYIGKRRDDDGGYIRGYIIYAKHFRQIISPTEASQHFTNKLTIANIAYGKVATTEESVPRNL